VSGRVAIVVLSWNGCDDTLACLSSLAAVTYEPISVVVVDNGSRDGTVDAVRAAFPSVELLPQPTNLGFAEGNNVGIRHALARGSEYVLVLNNDTRVDPGFLEPLLAAAEAHSDAGAVCPKILFDDAPDRIWFAGAGYDARRGYQGRLAGYGARDSAAFDGVRESDRATGTAMLVPAAVLERVGGFDRDLFAYSEDVDWSLRARGAGYRIYVAGDSRVYHRVSASSGGESSPTSIYYGVRNALVVAERHAPLGRFATRRRRATIVAAHMAQALRSGSRGAGIAAVLEGWRDFRAGVLGQRRASASSSAA
jgi:GT2 family glycosyltransferase